MSRIGRIPNFIFIKPIRALGNSRIMRKVDEAFQNKTKVVSAIAVGSLVLKDGIGGVMYVYQSLHNEKIPEDKREFVASLDFTNTGVMITTQLAMFALIQRPGAQKWLFNKMFGKYFDRAARKTYHSAVRNKAEVPVIGTTVHGEIDKLENSARKTFEVVTSIVAATVIGKRILTPFIATPLADYAPPLLHKIYGTPKKSKTSDDTFETSKT
jgi:hypothetical protein